MNELINLIPEFLKESKKQIKEIRKNLPDFIEEISNGGKVLFEDNSDFFRSIHSISGGSSFAGLKDIENISWKLEKILTNIFSGRTETSKEIAKTIEKTIDVLEYALKNKGKIKKKDGEEIEKTLNALLNNKEQKKDISGHKVKKQEKKQGQINTTEKNDHFSVTVSNDEEEEKDEAPVNQYISFRIGAENYAVPINYVYDMKEMLPCSRIPKQPEHFLGVANLRGNIVPVIDFRSFLGVQNLEFNEYTVFLMLKINGKIKGCVVDAINDVVVLEPENTHSTPSVSRKTNLEFVNFIAKDPKSGQFLIVLDVEKILENE